MSNQGLCRINDIPDGESKGFRYQEHQIIAVRQGHRIFLYHNRCPHLGIPLEWQVDQFLNHDRSLIQCNTHGALFEIDTGACISGPCGGEYLTPVKFIIDNDNIIITDSLIGD